MYITLSNLSGGVNQSDPPFAVPDDQVLVAENMDFYRSTLGGRRLGHEAITTSGLSTKVVFLHRHLKTADETGAELWAISTSGTSSVFAYKDTTWHDVTPTGTDALDVAEGQYAIAAQTAHGKLFLAYPTVSGVDRLHVREGSVNRRVGLAAPAAPSVANTGAGSYAGTRYFRVRYTVQTSGVTRLRSEPSDATTFAPSGTGASARVTKPAALSAFEYETHWEVEESTDNTNFYRIATVAVGTTTYDDSLTAAQVATTGTLSADIGDYSLPHNPKYLSLDQDRLLLGGSWEQPALGSRVAWTPVYGAEGAGNDERLEEDTDPFLDLDGYDGGELTALVGPLLGYHIAYKRKRIYKIVRTNARAQAYRASPYTDASGALKRSVVKGLDEAGRPCQYYWDPDWGPSRLGADGMQRCGEDICDTVSSVNLDAALPIVGEYYPEKGQVWWYIATGSSSTPDTRVKVDVQAFVPDRKGVRKGWSIDTGPYMAVLATTLFADNVEAGVARSTRLKPFVGTAISGALIVETETGHTDNGTAYRSWVRTKPLLAGGLQQRFGVKSAVVMGEASEAEIELTIERDYGLETASASVSLRGSPAGESRVVTHVDSLPMSEALSIQVVYGDAAPAETDWVLESIVIRAEAERELG